MKNEEQKFKDIEVTWNCRFHPFNSWHEIGCPHKEWTKEQYRDALIMAKKNLVFQRNQLVKIS